MIGALSIVRFRNPVKSPFELVMFFALVTLGVCAGVDVSESEIVYSNCCYYTRFEKFWYTLKKTFSFNLFNYSFWDGNITFSLEIETSEDIKQLNHIKD